MIKTVFTIFFSLLSLSTIAQVSYFEGGLKEAFNRAKSENKLVIIMGSATWCRPCKETEIKVLTDKEVGNYINSKFIFKKIYLDKDSQDAKEAKKRYKLNIFPTFLFLNEEGVELMRIYGGSADPTRFIDRIKAAIAKGNTIPERDEKLRQDPRYALEYNEFLRFSYRDNKRAKEILLNYLKNTPIKESVNSENIDKIISSIFRLDNEVLQILIANKKELIKSLGKKRYNNTMQSIGSKMFKSYLSSRIPKVKSQIKDVIKFIEENRSLMSDGVEFYIDNKESINSKNIDVVLKNGLKNFDKKDFLSADIIYTSVVLSLKRDEYKKHKEVLNNMNSIVRNKSLEYQKTQPKRAKMDPDAMNICVSN